MVYKHIRHSFTFLNTEIMKQILLMATIALFSFSSASAQCAKRGNCCTRQARIHRGVRTGQITPRERVVIARQQHDVRLAKRVAKADGVITPAERRIIRREKIQASNTIYRARHNNRTRH
jgi:tellurite resistance protein